MDYQQIERELSQQIRQRVADGLNAGAARLAADIQDHVPVRTGALQRSWGVLRPATLERLDVQVGSLLGYARAYYPYPRFRPVPPERDKGLQGKPLFNGKPDGGAQPSQVVRSEIESRLS